MHSKNSSKFQSVLTPALPVCDYMADHVRRGGGKTEVRDLKSLQVLLPSAQVPLVTRPGQAGPEDKQVSRLSSAWIYRAGVKLEPGEPGESGDLGEPGEPGDLGES